MYGLRRKPLIVALKFDSAKRVEGRENVGIWGEILLGDKGRGWKNETVSWRRDSCGVCLDVESREALEELCSALRFSGLGFSCLPFTVPKHVCLFS